MILALLRWRLFFLSLLSKENMSPTVKNSVAIIALAIALIMHIVWHLTQ